MMNMGMFSNAEKFINKMIDDAKKECDRVVASQEREVNKYVLKVKNEMNEATKKHNLRLQQLFWFEVGVIIFMGILTLAAMFWFTNRHFC